MTDVRFYHLTRTRLEDALPVMLGRTLERGGRAVVRLATPARLKALDEWLWTFDDAAFIPHGSEGGQHAADQRLLGRSSIRDQESLAETRHGFEFHIQKIVSQLRNQPGNAEEGDLSVCVEPVAGDHHPAGLDRHLDQ